MELHTIGIDLGKTVFHPVGFDLHGGVTGLRSLATPAVLCWAIHLGWLHFAGTKFAFISHPVTLVVFTLLALIELTLDKLPKTPARLSLLG